MCRGIWPPAATLSSPASRADEPSSPGWPTPTWPGPPPPPPAAPHAHLASAFVRVAGLVAPPQSLLRPNVAVRVLRGSLHPAAGTRDSLQRRDTFQAAHTCAPERGGRP